MEGCRSGGPIGDGGRVVPVADRQGLFDSEVDFLRECLNEAFPNPSAGPKSGGVGWTEHRDEDLVELVPPDDLMARLRFLPQTYLTQRRVKEKLLLAVTPPSAGCRIGLPARRCRRCQGHGRRHCRGPDHRSGADPKPRCELTPPAWRTIVDLGVDDGDVALLLALLAEDGPERAGDELPVDAAAVRGWAAGPAQRTHHAGRALLAGHGSRGPPPRAAASYWSPACRHRSRIGDSRVTSSGDPFACAVAAARASVACTCALAMLLSPGGPAGS